MSRYIIIGAGAVGAGLAAQLTEAGRASVLVGRGEGIKHLAAHGLRYVRPEGERVVQLVTASSPDEVELQQDDVLVLAVKTQDAETAVRQWAWRPVAGEGPAAVAAELPLVTLQNGLDAERIAARRFAHVYGASIQIPNRFTEQGVVVSGSIDPVAVVTLGRFPQGVDDTARAIAADFTAVSFLTQVSDDVQRWKTAKLLWNVGNALEVLSDDHGRSAEIAEGVRAEARAVFEAAGFGIADTAAERTIDVSGFTVAPGSGIQAGQQSTWQSFARGAAENEAEYLNGEIVLLGRLHGVPTPLNERVLTLIGQLTRDRVAPGTVDVSVLEGEPVVV